MPSLNNWKNNKASQNLQEASESGLETAGTELALDTQEAENSTGPPNKNNFIMMLWMR